jgi:hypothetical protein
MNLHNLVKSFRRARIENDYIFSYIRLLQKRSNKAHEIFITHMDGFEIYDCIPAQRKAQLKIYGDSKLTLIRRYAVEMLKKSRNSGNSHNIDNTGLTNRDKNEAKRMVKLGKVSLNE